MALRVVFADDNYLVREGVSALLAEADDVDLVDVVPNPELLLRSVAVNSPDNPTEAPYTAAARPAGPAPTMARS
jgi:hypothetical protein